MFLSVYEFIDISIFISEESDVVFDKISAKDVNKALKKLMPGSCQYTVIINFVSYSVFIFQSMS